MSYLDSYDQIEMAFEEGRGIETQFADVYRPTMPTAPEPTTPIGERIETEALLEIGGEFDGTIVRYRGVVLKPNFEPIRHLVEVQRFNQRTPGLPEPSFIIRQFVEWEGLTGLHEATATTGFTDGVFKELDETGEELDYRLWGVTPFTRPIIDSLFEKSILGAPDGREHNDTIAAIAERHPELLAHFTHPTRTSDTTGKFVVQSAPQLEALLATHLG